MSVSKSSDGSIVPIKLAQRFIHVIDFNADPLTCISASTGTVSYDSIQTPAHAKTDVAKLIEKSKHCALQPPHPVQVTKTRRVFRDDRLETPVLVDVETFDSAVKEQAKRCSETTCSQQIVHDWTQASKQVNALLAESSTSFRKEPRADRRRPTIFDLTIEVPGRKTTDFVMTKRTVSKRLAERTRNAAARDAHEQTMSVFRKLPAFH